MDLKDLKAGLAKEKRSRVRVDRRGNDPIRGIASAVEEAFAGKRKHKQTKAERKEYNRLYWQRYSARKRAEREAAGSGPKRQKKPQSLRKGEVDCLEMLRKRAAELLAELEDIKTAIRVIEML